MGIEVIHYKDDSFSIRVHDIHKVLDLLCPVKSRPMLMDTGMMSASKRLDKRKNAASAVPYIFGIHLLNIAWTQRQGISGIAQHLVWLFVHAYDRTLRVIRKLINIKNILHACYEFGIPLFGDTPVFASVRLKPVFFNALPIAFFPTGVSSATLASSSSRRSVQRECPSGAGLQAISIRRASARPSSLRLALSEFTLLLMETTGSIPPFAYSFTVFVTVDMQTPFDLADCWCVNTSPCASSRSISIWHLHFMVFDVFFLRMMAFNFASSSSVKEILYILGLAILNHRRFF